MNRLFGILFTVASACGGVSGVVADGGSQADGASHDASTDGGTVDATSDAPTDASTPDADRVDGSCVAHCKAMSPNGYSQALLGLYDCACTTCTASCQTTELCSGGSVAPTACGACIVAALDARTCTSHCSSTNTDCIAYQDCLKSACR